MVGCYKKKCRKIGVNRKNIYCMSCQEVVQYNLYETAHYMSIFFIPVIAFKKEYYFRCPVCGTEQKIQKDKAMEIINKVG